jgi:hypothetical protein
MLCKICQRNEIDSTSGICWECASKSYNVPTVEPPLDMGEGYTNYSPKEEPEDLTQVDK